MRALRTALLTLWLRAGVVAERRIYVAGSGHDMLGLLATAKEIVALSSRAAPRVLYLGTATYDDEAAAQEQTQNFRRLNCTVRSLDVAWKSPSAEQRAAAFTVADVVLISGGNTLFAVDRWVKLGIDALLRAAADRGVVLSGGKNVIWLKIHFHPKNI